MLTCESFTFCIKLPRKLSIDQVAFPAEAQPFIDYFEDTRIGRLNRGNRRRAPRYPIAIWNCYHGVIDGLPKTNNSVERWHRAFVEIVGASHPMIWKFFKALKLD